MTHSFKNDFSYIPALDGLRAAAVALVILAHYGLGHIVPGGLGVTVFFFLSGFLISRLLFAELRTSGTVSIRNFYARRFLRLYPALLFLIAGGSLVLIALGQPPALKHVLAGLFYYENYNHLVFSRNEELPFHILWSLAVEEHFYLVFPLLFLGLARRPGWLLMACGGLALLGLGLRLHGMTYGWADETYTYEASEMRMDSILYGVILATLVELERGRKLIARILTHWSAFCAGVALLGVSLLLREEFFRATVRYTLQGIALMPIFSALAFGGAARLGVLVRGILAHRAMVAMGKISYPLYLWHNICHLAVVLAVAPQAGKLAQGVLALMLSIGVASISYWLIERPALTLKKRFTPQAAHARPSDPMVVAA
jgi:peptidoglycan/LPS O-acetylase OafA/YrhL